MTDITDNKSGPKGHPETSRLEVAACNPALVVSEGGEIRADSRDVAAAFGKQHKNVLQSLNNLECSAEFRRLNFQPFKNKDLTGETTAYVLMTKDGFSFLAMGFTGQKAAGFKEAYIRRFNAMDAELRAPMPAVDPMQVLNDPGAMRGLLLTYSEKVLTLQADVAEMAPKAKVHDLLLGTEGTTCLMEAAKHLGQKPKGFIAWLQRNNWIYRRVGGGHWIAYQVKLNQGLLDHKLAIVPGHDGAEKIKEQVRVTALGMAKLAKLLGDDQVGFMGGTAH